MKTLVVESDKKIAKFVKKGLEDEGFEVDMAHSGDEGFTRILEGSYGLIVLDAALARKDGLPVLDGMRSRGNLTPVLMLSEKNGVEDIVACLEAGADDFVKKPFALVELVARLKALHRRASRDRGAKIFFADLCLDPVRHQVWRGETEVELTAKEYELLEFLVRHPNQVLTRNLIADAVWSGGFDSFTNIIDVYINYLRKKVDKGRERKLIHTVRGVGYILKEDAE